MFLTPSLERQRQKQEDLYEFLAAQWDPASKRKERETGEGNRDQERKDGRKKEGRKRFTDCMVIVSLVLGTALQ